MPILESIKMWNISYDTGFGKNFYVYFFYKCAMISIATKRGDNNMKHTYTYSIANREFVVDTGHVAKQANGAVIISFGDTAILSTVTGRRERNKAMDFFPLTVNYEERMYAAGKIPGGFNRREGRPSTDATLAARLIDRPLRPLFPKGFKNEVQVVNTVVSMDNDCSPETIALNGSSIALSISDIPFTEPVAGVDVGYIDGEYILYPTVEQKEISKIQLTVAGTATAVNMVEAGANEVSEDIMLGAIAFGHKAIQGICGFIASIQEELGKTKFEFEADIVSEEHYTYVNTTYRSTLEEVVFIEEKQERAQAIAAITEEAIEKIVSEKERTEEERKDLQIELAKCFDKVVKSIVREYIAVRKIRPDGRGTEEIRPLSSEVGVFKRPHGSSMFTRGQTQALSFLTLGTQHDEQIMDGIDTTVQPKRFMLHYNFPPYSVGETGRIGFTGRREIGHGMLGERALLPVIPSKEDFPYTIRLVSEIIESNGSTSQASICAGTLALMHGGVPIKAPVAGIAMGLVANEDVSEYTILSDIQGMEDHLGDMDFKVAGTEKGITALQMDIKITGITLGILEEALAQAKIGRMHILNHMLETLPEPNKELSPYAPKVISFKIDPAKIKDVIGKGGERITKIVEEFDVKIDIDDEGVIAIYGLSSEMMKGARETIEMIVRVAKIDEVYSATVTRIEKFGAFVELFKGTEGLLHVSNIAHERIANVSDVLKVGDTIEVKVTEIDDRGRVQVSRKALLPKPAPTENKQ